ncbi:MAG: cupin domain-containing protein [Actinomycetales bacterium]
MTRAIGLQDGVGFSMVVFDAAPGFQAPPDMHANTREDWAAYVLSGEVEFRTEQGPWRVDAGDTVILPRGNAFAWSNPGEAPARWLAIYCPAGFEQYFFDLADATAENREAIADPQTLQDIVRPLWARYGIR